MEEQTQSNLSTESSTNKTVGDEKRITKAILVVVLVIVLAKVLGLAKQVIQASYFGASLETDIINLSQEFVVNIDFVISQMIITAFTSIYIHLLKKDDLSSKKFILDTAKLFLLISLVITILVVSLAPFIAKILAPSYSEEATAKLSFYLRIFSTLLIFFVLIGVTSSILNSHEKFVQRELTTVFQNVIVILCIVSLSSLIGTEALVVSMFVYVAFNVLYLGIVTRKYWKPSLQFVRDNPFKNGNIKTLVKMLFPLLIGYGMIYINQQVDKILVSSMAEGTVTALAYAAVLSNLIVTILASLCTVFYSRITSHVANEDMKGAAVTTNKYLALLVSVIVPVSVITFMCSSDVVKMIFGYGKFDENAVEVTSQALMGYAFIFIPYCFKNMYAKFLYANKTTKWPMINGSIGIAINIGLSILLSRYMGVFGVALATTIAEVVGAILNVISSKIYGKKNMSLSFLYMCMPLWLVGGALCFVICYFLRPLMMNWNVFLRFGLLTITSMASYGVIATLPILLLIKKRILVF